MEELVCDQCDEFIQNGKPFSAVAVTEALKLKELRNPTNGVDIRHRHVNDLVRNYMAQVSNSANYVATLTQPTVDEHGRAIHAPDGVYVYHPHTFDATLYRHPALTKPLSMQGFPVAPTATAPIPAPAAPTLPLVNVRYTLTDDNPRGEETHIFRATFSKKEASNFKVYDAITQKMNEKLDDLECVNEGEFDPDDEDGPFPHDFDLSMVEGNVIIHLKYNDENDKTQEKTFDIFDQFDKEYGFDYWKELEARKPKSNDDGKLGNLISTLPNSSKSNLPDLHLPIYNDGRVGIPSGIVKGLAKDAIILMTGDVAGTVKFVSLQDYLSAQD
jgi:hypothetical protein